MGRLTSFRTFLKHFTSLFYMVTILCDADPWQNQSHDMLRHNNNYYFSHLLHFQQKYKCRHFLNIPWINAWKNMNKNNRSKFLDTNSLKYWLCFKDKRYHTHALSEMLGHASSARSQQQVTCSLLAHRFRCFLVVCDVQLWTQHFILSKVFWHFR